MVWFKRSLILITTTLLCTGCAARVGVPVGQVPSFETPQRAEVESTKLGVVNALKGEGKSSTTTGPMHDRAQRITNRLSAAAGAGSFHFPVLIANAGEEVNAMVADGKTVVVYEELMRRVPNDSELATVLAHEMGHVLGKHHQDKGAEGREEEVAVGSSILGSVADIALSSAGYSGLGSVAGSVTETAASTIGMGAYVLSYNRDMEYEADHIGLMLMAKAGYDPQAALGFWSKSDEIFGSSNSMSFFSTHPANLDRLEKMREYMPIALGYYRPGKVNTAATTKKQSK